MCKRKTNFNQTELPQLTAPSLTVGWLVGECGDIVDPPEQRLGCQS